MLQELLIVEKAASAWHMPRVSDHAESGRHLLRTTMVARQQVPSELTPPGTLGYFSLRYS